MLHARARSRPAALLAIPAVALALQILTATHYGYFRDELYQLACSRHLAWGYVDHPPLSAFLLWLVRHLLGDSLRALRILPSLSYATAVFVTGRTCRRMGGGSFARAAAMIGAASAPVYLFAGHVYGVDAFDLLFWTLSTALLVRIFDDGPRGLWIVLGIVLGLGLLDGLGVLGLGFGVLIGMRLSSKRGWYMTPWPWACGAISFLFFSPHVAWQVARGWPTLQFVRYAKTASVSPWGFLGAQLLLMNPPTVLLALAGLVWLLFGAGRRKFLALGVAFLVVLALLLAFHRSKPDHLGPAYALLLPAGGVACERLLAGRGRGWLRAGALSLLLASGCLLLPSALPVLPVERYLAFARALPEHYADMFGWEAIVTSVARAYSGLSPEEREHAGIFVQNYGEAGAIDLYGAKLGLPRAMSGHAAYWYWGPDPNARDVLVILGGAREDHERVCAELLQVDTIECGSCMPYENGQAVYVCRGLRTPLPQLWPRLKRFV